jgi:HD-GYP domain-containing protein (c-di-GMP phosphodiesterase class II)
MKRITVKHAEPGMVTEQPIYDHWGNLLLQKSNELTPELIDDMKKKGVTEIFIRDWRVHDVIVTPLFSPLAEGALAKSFRWLVKDNSSKMTLSDGHLSRVKAAVLDMVVEIAMNTGDINVSCDITPQEYVYLQPVKTAGLALAIGNALKMTNDELLSLGTAAVLKDVCVPMDVIDTVDRLSEGGPMRMRDHASHAFKMLSSHRATAGVIALAVAQHHENWSGSGYPKGIMNTEISRLARIIAIADTFVDLLSERPGRGKYMSHEAIEYIMAGGGDQFDPKLVEIFVRHIPSYPTGLTVLLNTGETAIVSDPKLGFVARPIVRICTKPNGEALEKPVDVDLSKAQFQRMLITKIIDYD